MKSIFEITTSPFYQLYPYSYATAQMCGITFEEMEEIYERFSCDRATFDTSIRTIILCLIEHLPKFNLYDERDNLISYADLLPLRPRHFLIANYTSKPREKENTMHTTNPTGTYKVGFRLPDSGRNEVIFRTGTIMNFRSGDVVLENETTGEITIVKYEYVTHLYRIKEAK